MDIDIILSLMQEETQEKEVRLLKVSMAEPWLECRLVQSQKHPASRQSALFYLVYTPSCSPSDKCPKNGAVSPEGSECAMAKSSRLHKTGGSGVPPRQSWKASVSEEESAHADRGLFFHLELILGCVPCAMQPLLPAAELKVLLSFSESPPYPGCADGWSWSPGVISLMRPI